MAIHSTPQNQESNSDFDNQKDSEKTLLNKILLEAPKHGLRLFRNNVGLGWVGKGERFNSVQTVVVRPGDVVVRQARPLHSGLCVGSGDLIGFNQSGKFISVEIKTETGRISSEQKKFQETVLKFNGIGLIVRSIEEFILAFSNKPK